MIERNRMCVFVIERERERVCVFVCECACVMRVREGVCV